MKEEEERQTQMGTDCGKTQCKNEGRIQSTPVPKNLTLHRMSKIEFQPDFRNPQMHSFPNMPIMGWVALVEVGQKKDFLQKSAEKTAILSDTNRDHLTLEGHNSLNFKDF